MAQTCEHDRLQGVISFHLHGFIKRGVLALNKWSRFWNYQD